MFSDKAIAAGASRDTPSPAAFVSIETEAAFLWLRLILWIV
jgi:hypothetical protein